jgi:tetratricopeptide (TPR) repeat protein
MWLATTGAFGQAGNRDYYTAKLTKEGAELLKNVELYHIGPGISRMSTHTYGGALQDFEFILDFFPNHPRGLALISELCDLKWKSPQCDADAWFQKAIDRNPHASQTYLIYGLHLQRQNHLPEAIESYKKSIDLNPVSANAHYDLALAYFDQKQFDLANRHAQISYELGMPLPGLRDKLTRAGKWKPLDPEELKGLTRSSESSPSAAGQK